MYELYDEYKKTMEISKKARNKRQKLNREIREKYEEPYSRKDFNENKKDITLWNSMIRDLEESMKMIEMYLDYDDRYYLHKEYDEIKNRIYNKKSYEGEVPLETLYGEFTPDNTEIIYEKELQGQIEELLDEVLTERQKQIIKMYFWDEISQGEIASRLGVNQSTIARNIQKTIKVLRNNIKVKEIYKNYFKDA